MPFIINIGSIKINNIANNGSFNVGGTLHNSHTANTKAHGTNMSVGDFSPAASQMNTVSLDPDVSDQDQIGNPSPAANSTV